MLILRLNRLLFIVLFFFFFFRDFELYFIYFLELSWLISENSVICVLYVSLLLMSPPLSCSIYSIQFHGYFVLTNLPNIELNVIQLSCVRPGSIDPMTAVVQRVKGFAYYSLSFSRHNKNIKMEHFFLYILSRYFIWLHKWKGFNDICASLKYERMIDYSFQLPLILYPLRCRETISLRGPVFHRSHGHNLVRPGHQSEVNYGYVSKICR